MADDYLDIHRTDGMPMTSNGPSVQSEPLHNDCDGGDCVACNRETQRTETKTVEINPGQIVVDRQALLTIVSAVDMGKHAAFCSLPKALDKLREPFFSDEFATGKARSDFSMNKYG